MAIITVFAPSHCMAGDLAVILAKGLGYDMAGDAEIAAAAGRRFDVPPEKLMKTISGKVSAFNRFTREREIGTSRLSVAVAGLVQKDRLVVHGNSALLFPKNISHVLSVCLKAPLPFRLARAAGEGFDESSALKAIKRDDERLMGLAGLLSIADPFEPALYDMTLAMDRHTPEEAAELIMANARRDVVLPTSQSVTRAADFALSAHVGAALAAEGHDVGVSAEDGAVTVTINQHVMMLSRLEDEIKATVTGLSGVRSVTVKVGPEFHKPDIYRKADFSLPSRVLLVDDERQFVETLSDRLSMRDVGSAVVYNGEDAISFVDDDEPEVMLLDLNLPGMNGIEVLRRVKQDHPRVEVIILTGHGSARDEAVCRELGAFAYLEKPVSIDVLAETMRSANEKAREKKG